MRFLAAAILLLASSPVFAEECHDRLTAVFSALNSGPHRVVLETTNEDGGVESVLTDVVPGVGIRGEMTVAGGVERVLVVGDKGWFGTEAGWEPMDPSLVKFLADTSDLGAPLIRASLSNVACTTEGFTFEIPGQPDTVAVTLDAEGRLARLVGKVDGAPVDIRYTYDPAITIVAPM